MTIEEELKKCVVFSILNQAELKKVASVTEERVYEAGAPIFQQGDDVTGLMVINQGKAALQKTLPSTQQGMFRRITVDIVNQNEVISWATEPQVHGLSAVCLQRAKVLHINGLRFEGLIREEPEVGYKLMRELIKVVASRLEETRNVLASERLVSVINLD